MLPLDRCPTAAVGLVLNVMAHVAGWVIPREGAQVPAMALAPSWHMAAVFVLAERVGRAIRKPTVEAMLSYSTGKHGEGWVYAVNTAMDETGATIGPLFMALVLFKGADFRMGYALLLIASPLALATLAGARVVFPVPSRLEAGGPSTAHAKGFGRVYWFYMAAGTCFAAGVFGDGAQRVTEELAPRRR